MKLTWANYKKEILFCPQKNNSRKAQKQTKSGNADLPSFSLKTKPIFPRDFTTEFQPVCHVFAVVLKGLQ